MAQTKTGTVISNKMEKTIVVKITTQKKHPLYKKIITRSQKIKAHDELNAQVGQTVKIAQTRPYSKDVHFITVEVSK